MTVSVSLDWEGRTAAEALAEPHPDLRLVPRTGHLGRTEHLGRTGRLGSGDGALPADLQEHDLVIESDNLPALHALRRTHAHAVKVVYIDPPYNTGNVLPYRDTFGASGHAGWMSMMLPRLRLTADLLRPDGVVFVQVDDRESGHMVLLGNEVFGEENYLGALVHQRAKGGGQAKRWVRGHDYVHVWAREAASVGPFLREKQKPARYATIDGQRYLVEDDVLRVSFGKYTRGQERRLMYEDVLEARGEAKKAEIDAGLESGLYRLQPWGDAGKHAVVRLTPAEQASSKMYSIIRALGQEGRDDLEALGLGGTFGYPKPVSLLRELVRSQTFFDRDAIVLDFFAGSGTTAQAVHELNALDGGSRRFVLVQQTEELRTVAGARLGAEGTVSAGTGPAAEAPAPGTADRTGNGPGQGASGAGTGTGEGTVTIADLCRTRLERVGARFLDLTVEETTREMSFHGTLVS
ncbi:site-specific DNA-methyltransferase [Brevibacterium litoralis]|uniref:site-specific DNA-methyltransferase n=1 Tax=Brevibacterium litoralis TaxID=3138935 RepID=UPI0032F07DDC